MSVFQIPLTNVPQQFDISLADKVYTITCKYNDADEGGWVLDIADQATDVDIICNLPLVTGLNLLDGLEYLGIEGIMYVFTDGDTDAVPTLDNLGVESHLYFQTEVADG